MLYESTAERIIENFDSGLPITDKISDYELLCLALSYLAMSEWRKRNG
jgi:hypothetical protein